MKPWQEEGISSDDKFEFEEYSAMQKMLVDAVDEGNLDQVKHALSIGAEINSLGERWTGWSAIHHAADHGHEHLVKYLLDNGADKNRITLDYSNYTALHMAVSKKHYNVISVLLEAGVDTEMFTATGCCGTALHLAASFADFEMCSALLNAGANAGEVSEEGSTILHYLAGSMSDEAVDILKLLVEKHKSKLDINAVDYDGYTPLMRAASFGDIEQVKLFLQQGADINVKEYNFEKTALKIAEEMAKENVVELLKNL